MTNVRVRIVAVVAVGMGLVLFAPGGPRKACSQPVPGGTLDPLTIPKFVTPLVIPPEMPKSTVQPGFPAATYNIAVRQFKQQILPGGVWNGVNGRSDSFGATTVWSYGRAQDKIPGGFVAPAPLSSNISFNYPAFTVENTSGIMTRVRWINDLVDTNGNYLPHLLPVDQTLHWANPPATGCIDGTSRTECRTFNPAPYTGPVPIVTHVHGAHVNASSDGYPEAWWLPAAKNIPAGYATHGALFDEFEPRNTVKGSAYYAYENDQPATTLWFHDHTLGITRNNVYAGPAGFWLVRGGSHGDTFLDDGTTALPRDGRLPGPAPRAGMGDPNFNATFRATIREIPVVIQDRSFNADGSLFYPNNRAFFEELNVPGATSPQIPGAGVLNIPFIPNSDISAIWNPEVFFNTMVVNGTTWPQLDAAPARYRLRLLNGCNSRTLNLALFTVTGAGPDGVMGTADDVLGTELPFYQIGSEQGFLPRVVMVTTGRYTPLPGNGTIPATGVDAPDPMQALLLGPAERADVIVDFSGLADGTVVRMVNTAPDAPFGGFPDTPADIDTTGQVMQFKVKSALLKASDVLTTPARNLVLPAEGQLPAAASIRQITLNEEVSARLCVQTQADGSITTLFVDPTPLPGFLTTCAAAGGFPMEPLEAKLGVLMTDPLSGMKMSMPMMWADMITEAPVTGTTETWEIYNLTMDAHPIHLHLVRFEVVDRQPFDMMTFEPSGPAVAPQPYEQGYKDTVLAYPGQITRVKATFDKIGLYVWHCHILEHEDNEMMRPYMVKIDPAFPDVNADGKLAVTDALDLLKKLKSPLLAGAPYDLTGDGTLDVRDVLALLRIIVFGPPR